MQRIARPMVMLFVGGLIGAGIFASAQQYRPTSGYALWGKSNDAIKLVYLTGYSDAEQVYRLAIDRGIQLLCTDEGKKSVADFEYRFPMPIQVTLSQEKQGIDAFYKDFRNQGIDLLTAQNIVRMQILGRPQAEIDDYMTRARSGQN
jgi:hypothetical protein